LFPAKAAKRSGNQHSRVEPDQADILSDARKKVVRKEFE
jgi:hypothetical protein